jgi:hypothetical protein
MRVQRMIEQAQERAVEGLSVYLVYARFLPKLIKGHKYDSYEEKIALEEHYDALDEHINNCVKKQFDCRDNHWCFVGDDYFLDTLKQVYGSFKMCDYLYSDTYKVDFDWVISKAY